MINTCLAQCRRWCSDNMYSKISKRASLRCSISRIVRTNDLCEQGGFPLRAVAHGSQSSLCTPGVWYPVNYSALITVWINSHHTACCVLLVLLPILWIIVQSASWVIFVLALSAMSHWTNCCLSCCFVPISDIFDQAPANCQDLDPHGPG